MQPKVRFAISSSSVFSRTDTTTDSETFYHSLLDLFEDPEESKEVDDLLTWWNRYFLLLFVISLRLMHCYVPAKCFPLPLPLNDLSAPTVPYRKYGSNVLRSNKLQIQT
jgi:hypothetical protein